MLTSIRSIHLKPIWLLTLVLLFALSPVSAAPIVQTDDATPAWPRPDQWLVEAAQRAKAANPDGGGERQGRRRNLSLVGAYALPGFNADVWAYKGFAYVGSWGRGELPGIPNPCPATGVRILDISDPRNPVLIGAVAVISGTSQEDVEVGRVDTPFFHGDLLVTGIQACTETDPQGVDIWDVSDPHNPEHLAFWPSNAAAGVHELDLFKRGNRAYVAAAAPFSEPAVGQGDFRLVDVTDPRNPVQVSDWGLADIGVAWQCDDQVCYFDHSALADQTGTKVILSYWDYGAIYLDISDPANPTFIGHTVYPAGADGDTHSVTLAQGGSLLLTADEDFSPEEPNPPPDDTWGFLRIWDVSNPAAPTEIGRFLTENSMTIPPPDNGFYSIHNPVVRGNTAYLSWYSDGVRVVDISQPTAPREIASFVPPDVPDPFGFFPDKAIVWGVVVEGDLILLSDINAGLYILRHTP